MSDLRKEVLDYASQRKGKKVGNGSCWDLADKALTRAKALSAPNYGAVTHNSDDRWGQPVSLEGALPGDVLQFKDHKAELNTTKKIKITFPDQSRLEYEETH